MVHSTDVRFYQYEVVFSGFESCFEQYLGEDIVGFTFIAYHEFVDSRCTGHFEPWFALGLRKAFRISVYFFSTRFHTPMLQDEINHVSG